MRTVLAVVALLLSAGLSGCSDDKPPPDADAAVLKTLQWPTLTVYTTPSEPFEQTRPIYAIWSGGVFAVWAEAEADLAQRTVIDGDTVYSNRFAAMGWTSFGRLEAVSPNSERLVLWDLPRLVATPGLDVAVNQTGNVLNATLQGPVPTSRGDMDVTVRLGAVDGRVVWAHVATDYAREAPFTMRAEDAQFPFPAQRPASVLKFSERRTLDSIAQDGHVFVIKLLQNYTRNHVGTVPDEPSAESLSVELLLSGRDWPDNAYTGKPLAVGAGSGDMGWKKCGTGDARYLGSSWDGYLVTENFGQGCRDGSPPPLEL